MAYVNPLIAKWKAGKPTFGAWLTHARPVDRRVLRPLRLRRGDRRPAAHARSRPTTCTAIFTAIELRGVVPSTRVPLNDYIAIGKALDLGAQMVIVPMVNNAAEAAPGGRRVPLPAARATGRRGPCGPQHVMGNSPQELEAAACVLMVETKDGLANVDEIAATPGVDAIYIGPGDLALGLGRGLGPGVADARRRTRRTPRPWSTSARCASATA